MGRVRQADRHKAGMMMEPFVAEFSSAGVKVPSALVSTGWLHAHLHSPRLRIVDATLFLPGAGRNAYAEFLLTHIPGAVFLDMDTVSDPDSALPNTMPTAFQFGQVVGSLGIGNEDLVVIYDALGIMSAPRIWWMFHAFGHEQVAVLDGGLPKWRREQRPLGSGSQELAARIFTANSPDDSILTMEQVANAVRMKEQIVDARSANRFAGLENEPRPGLRSGHIPGSRNLPYTNLLDASTGAFVSPADLAERFMTAGVSLERPVICTCGSGVSACVLALALHEIGKRDVFIYDGSWTQWGSDPAMPIETGL
jgi:thiosulfate/3-mercaptopyruvate sulfurtransferase